MCSQLKLLPPTNSSLSPSPRHVHGVTIDEHNLINERFDDLDVDGSGHIDATEFYSLLNDLARQESIDVTLEQLEDAFAYMDENKNDVATKAEFAEFFVKVSETLSPILWLVTLLLVTSDL